MLGCARRLQPRRGRIRARILRRAGRARAHPTCAEVAPAQPAIPARCGRACQFQGKGNAIALLRSIAGLYGLCVGLDFPEVGNFGVRIARFGQSAAFGAFARDARRGLEFGAIAPVQRAEQARAAAGRAQAEHPSITLATSGQDGRNLLYRRKRRSCAGAPSISRAGRARRYFGTFSTFPTSMMLGLLARPGLPQARMRACMDRARVKPYAPALRACMGFRASRRCPAMLGATSAPV